MGCKGYEHGQGIKEEISQKGTDTAYQESTGGVQDQGRRHDDDIVQVEVAAGDRQAKGRKTDVHGHHKAADGQPPCVMADSGCRQGR